MERASSKATFAGSPCSVWRPGWRMGSEHACAILGLANAEGRFGFDKDPQEATRWYREMQTSDLRNSVEAHREQAAAWLREHP